MSVRTIVFLTALECEYEAVKAHLEEVKPHFPRGDDIEFEEKSYTTGTYRTSKGMEWQVIVRRQSQGNYKAIQETDWAIRRFEPNYLFFVGIAGGDADDVKLGDVVVAEKVIGYESGREQEPSSKSRPITKEPADFLVELAKYVVDEGNWLGYIKDREDCSPKAYVRPIASGEKTVASRRFAKKMELGVVAFEKEGFGFLEGISGKNQYGIVIRGISDLLKGKKITDKQGWQLKAARHAAGFAFAMLDKLPEFPPQDCREAKKVMEISDKPPWDVFVSYAEIDDQPLPGTENGWVTTLVERLNAKLLLLQRGKGLSFYPQGLHTETKFRKDRLMKYTRSHALLHSKLVMVILSPSYLDSKSSYPHECDAFSKCKNFLVVRKEEISPYPLPACVGRRNKNLLDGGKVNSNTEEFERFPPDSPEYEFFLDNLAKEITGALGK